MALMSLFPMLFSKFFSGRDPAERRYKELKYMLDPERLRAQGISQYQQDINGPEFQSAIRDIVSSGGNFATKMAGNAARAGLDTSGLGALVNAGASSLSGINIAKLKAAQFAQSRQMTDDRAFKSANILGSAPMPTNYTAGFAGAGLNAMLQYLLNRQAPAAASTARTIAPLSNPMYRYMPSTQFSLPNYNQPTLGQAPRIRF